MSRSLSTARIAAHLQSAFVGVTEAARILGVTGTTVREYADCGRLRFVRDPAGRRLLLREDVLRIAAVRHTQGTAP